MFGIGTRGRIRRLGYRAAFLLLLCIVIVVSRGASGHAATGGATCAGVGRRARAARRNSAGRRGTGEARCRAARADRRATRCGGGEARRDGDLRSGLTADRRLDRRDPGRCRRGHRCAALVRLGPTSGLRSRGATAVDRGRSCVRPRFRHRLLCRMDSPPGSWAAGAALADATQRHPSGPRLVRAARPRPRRAADPGLCRCRVHHLGDGARSAHPLPDHVVGASQCDDRGSPRALCRQSHAAARRHRRGIRAPRRRDPQLSLHLDQAVHLLGDIRLRRARGGLVARRSRSDLRADAQCRGPGAGPPRDHLRAAEPSADRQVDRRRPGGHFRLGSHSPHPRRDLARPRRPLHFRHLPDLRAAHRRRVRLRGAGHRPQSRRHRRGATSSSVLFGS